MKSFVNTLRELWKDPMGKIGIIGVVLLIAMALLAPMLAPFTPEQIGMKFQAPSTEHLFGTDKFGRDVFSRVLYGARVSLEVGIIAVGIGALAGYLLGLVAGYFEGWVDRVIMCVMDILFAFPSILLAIFISAVLGKGITNTMIAIGIVNIPVFCRTVRAAVISAKGLEYVENAKSVGVKTGPILVRHISPNVVAPFTVQATLALSGAILTEATLSFLGMGIQPPNPSWGSMLSEARSYMVQYPWTALFPLLFIVLTILVFNILGDALRDVLDPKLKV
ncbi:MAG: ABC transporter permease [Intestinimonas massiliensis]|uniref:ABC transporter permease n=1 Tax=Intestinimonas massiliensis (ex Afouda et al. 2020) TaxID=1673721 RepID=UPI00242BC218|nr:ABC transporter permease [Intestinimonas massiliensis (ex Afouda et al. 2020)]